MAGVVSGHSSNRKKPPASSSMPAETRPRATRDDTPRASSRSENHAMASVNGRLVPMISANSLPLTAWPKPSPLCR